MVSERREAWGVGFPAWLYLNDFARIVYEAFDYYPVLVGSALERKNPRDVDVRVVLPADDYLRLVGPIWEINRLGTRWASLCRAYSALGSQMTGLPVDFQVQVLALPYSDKRQCVLGGDPYRTDEGYVRPFVHNLIKYTAYEQRSGLKYLADK